MSILKSRPNSISLWGGRYSDQAQTFAQLGRKPQNPTIPLRTSTDKVFTWSADARYRFTPNAMVYARVATGFVPGGPNVAPPTPLVVLPLTYDSSTTTNYEVGFKGGVLDNALTVELAAFQIDWKGIQVIQLFPSGTPGLNYGAVSNAAAARSRGVELALNYRPVEGLTLGFNGAYIDAKLTEQPPAGVVGYAGERLPVTPRWQLAANAEYKWPMGSISGFVGADWRHLSRRFAGLTNTAATRQSMPGYHVFNLRAGVEGENWRLAAYVKNVGNVLAISYLTPDTGPFLRADYLTPRAIGLDLSFDF